MYSDQKKILLTNTHSRERQAGAPFALSFLIALSTLTCHPLPACATRLPGELSSALKSLLPECRIRLDGAIETKEGDLYLPIQPAKPSTAKLVRLKETLPLAKPDAKVDWFVFDNGYIFARVMKKLNIKTFASLSGLPEKTRQTLLAGHMPNDLIVPDGFCLPASFKPIIGEVNVTLLKELPGSVATAAGAGANKGGSTAKPVAGKSGGPAVSPGSRPTAVAGTGTGAGTGSGTGSGSTAPDGNGISEAKISSKGNIFVTSPSSGTITLVSGESMTKVAEVPTEGTPAGMALAGEHLYIADQSKNRIMILDVKERNFMGQIDLPDKSRPKSIVALPNGKLLYVSESGLGQIAVVEVETSKVLLTTKVPPGPSRMAITPNGNTVLILNVPTGQLTFLSTLNQKVLGTIAVGSNPTAVCVSPNSEIAYVSCRSSNYVAIIDIAQKKMLGGMKTGNSPTGLAVDNEGKKLYVALAKDNKIAVFDLETRALIKEHVLPSDVDFPGTLCLLPDGKKLVVSSASTESIGIFNVEKGEFEDRPVIGHGTDETFFVPIN